MTAAAVVQVGVEVDARSVAVVQSLLAVQRALASGAHLAGSTLVSRGIRGVETASAVAEVAFGVHAQAVAVRQAGLARQAALSAGAELA